MNKYLIENAALLFWEDVGTVPPYPRSLEDWFPFAYPLTVVWLPNLTIGVINDWAYKHRVGFQFPGNTARILCGCLLPGDTGIIFVDANDSVNEQRFTIAHELAHFLFDYFLPRERAIQLLGQEILEVLEGRRKPTPEERLDGVLAGVPLRIPGHLMNRPEGGVPSNAVLDIEDRADRLALELLAPAATLQQRMEQDGIPDGYRARLVSLITILFTEYGLPQKIGAFYAKWLLNQWGEPTFRDWLDDEV